MQCIWFIYAQAESFRRQKKFGLALRGYEQIYGFFVEFWDDQIDFHSYATRKQTLRSYIEMFKNFTNIKRNPYFLKCAKSAVVTYLELFEGGEAAEAMVEGVSLSK
jgi:hypothetical protein